MLAFACVPTMMFADFREHLHRFELGLSAGVGFYVAPRNPVAGNDALYRIHSYDALYLKQGHGGTFKWPGIETVGGSLGYRFDTRWTLRAQATGQRIHFIETNTQYEGSVCNETYTYYNALCHLDAIAEFNILNYGNVMQPEMGLYNVTPYVGLGLGMTFYNKDATIRSAIPGGSNLEQSSTYPIVGSKNKLTGKKDLGVAAYIPAVFGVKWRINDYVQLKGAFQYQIYLTKGNLEGGCPIGGETMNGVKVVKNQESKSVNLNAIGRPTFDKMTSGVYHDCIFSLSVIANLGKWYEDRVITY
jgi:hypothetical protein